MTRLSHLRPGSPDWLRWPRHTARSRFTAVYTGLFLLFGAALLTITFVLFQGATEYSKPHLPSIPRTPAAVQQLQLPQLPQAVAQLAQDRNQLSQVQTQLLQLPPGQTGLLPTKGVPQLSGAVSQLAQDQHQLAQDQHQLAQAVNQLAQAVHQVAQAGTAQAAQRAADSHQLLVNSGIALAIVALLALLAGWLVAGRMLRPVRTITATARRISATNLRERLALDRADEEFKRLGDTLDDLFARLAAAFEAQRHFVANASHELRTPLTAERNLLQVALDDPGSSAETWRSTAHELLASNDEQKHLIEALLTLASSEGELDDTERTDLAGICQSALPGRRLEADRLGLRLETAICPAPLDGDPRLIERLVANLIDNAIGHNVTGGHVRISTGATDGRAVLSVTNTGPIIPVGEIDRLFRPFERLDAHRIHHKDGHGLGLSIVGAIAASHQATVTAYPEPEGGLSVTVTFPPVTLPNISPNVTPGGRRLTASRA
jgi:signal transduction histidine kinase